MLCYALFCVLYSFAIILMGTRELAYYSIVFLMSFDYWCSVVLSRNAEGWSVVGLFPDHTYFFEKRNTGIISESFK